MTAKARCRARIYAWLIDAVHTHTLCHVVALLQGRRGATKISRPRDCTKAHRVFSLISTDHAQDPNVIVVTINPTSIVPVVDRCIVVPVLGCLVKRGLINGYDIAVLIRQIFQRPLSFFLRNNEKNDRCRPFGRAFSLHSPGCRH